jgi:predicted transcriptional regulator
MALAGTPENADLGRFALLTSGADAGFGSEAISDQIVGVPVVVAGSTPMGVPDQRVSRINAPDGAPPDLTICPWIVEETRVRLCIANAMHENAAMKTATLPPLRVAPELRQAAEAALREGESLSSLMEQSLREEVNRRRMQAEFIARGLAARDEAKRTGVYYSKDESLAALDTILARHKPGPR